MGVEQLTLALVTSHNLCERNALTYTDRFDVTPVVALAGSVRNLAESIGVTTGVVHKWAARGVDWCRADQVAIAIGRHPGTIWPEWWAA